VPTYQYACTACSEQHEAVQAFTDAPLTECPACGGRLRKVFSAVGVVFKGSGFYKTDSRKTDSRASGKSGEGSATATTGDGAAKSDSAGSSGGSSTPASGGSSGPSSSSTSSVPAAKSA
jgi:putative FmdB family regulatory protein